MKTKNGKPVKKTKKRRKEEKVETYSEPGTCPEEEIQEYVKNGFQLKAMDTNTNCLH